jgi:hypothetical protein
MKMWIVTGKIRKPQSQRRKKEESLLITTFFDFFDFVVP